MTWYPAAASAGPTSMKLPGSYGQPWTSSTTGPSAGPNSAYPTLRRPASICLMGPREAFIPEPGRAGVDVQPASDVAATVAAIACVNRLLLIILNLLCAVSRRRYGEAEPCGDRRSTPSVYVTRDDVHP
jgi:hypothetical protein